AGGRLPPGDQLPGAERPDRAALAHAPAGRARHDLAAGLTGLESREGVSPPRARTPLGCFRRDLARWRRRAPEEALPGILDGTRCRAFLAGDDPRNRRVVMLDRGTFIDAILETPDDDAPRLVYADWLDEHGGEADRARAEFIRVGCEVAKQTAGDPR